MTELERLSAALDAAAAGGGVGVLATLAAVHGSAYRGAGARLVVAPDGTTTGAISGGCLEKDVAAHAEAVRTAGQGRRVAWDLTRDDDAPWGLGMGCAARLEVLLEPCPGGAPSWLRTVLARHAARQPAVVVVGNATRLATADEAAAVVAAGASQEGPSELRELLLPPLALCIGGDGPDAAPLVALARTLGWVVQLVGRDETPGILDARTAAIVMSHHYARDLALLRQLLPSPAAYVGVLGPRRRTARLLADLAATGDAAPIPASDRLAAPAGLDIGAESPEEIALAILAEVRAVFADRKGGRLRDREGPIHDRVRPV